jgi:hypothetical protein
MLKYSCSQPNMAAGWLGVDARRGRKSGARARRARGGRLPRFLACRDSRERERERERVGGDRAGSSVGRAEDVCLCVRVRCAALACEGHVFACCCVSAVCETRGERARAGKRRHRHRRCARARGQRRRLARSLALLLSSAPALSTFRGTTLVALIAHRIAHPHSVPHRQRLWRCATLPRSQPHH